MANDFLDIISFSEESNSKDISVLKDLYNDIDLLKNMIEKLLRKRLDGSLIYGKKILLKPNWVTHSYNKTEELSKITNESFIIAALLSIIEYQPREIIIGDAPIQGCLWNKLISREFMEQVVSLSVRYGIKIKIMDFRRRRFEIKRNSPEKELRPLSDYIIFDIGNDSFLEPITTPGKSKFRVTNYDPARMTFAHSPGIHKYCIIKDFFEADIIISLPKIKTHQKTGITGALKNIVGLNGDKDFLPHHRIGGTLIGGDCYPGRSLLRHFAELLLDLANRNQGKSIFWFWQKLSSLLWMISLPGPEHNIAAGWYGNDTTWRMVLDINRIAVYGKPDGSISDTKQRQIFSLCDAIIAGQGNGPLHPDPLPLGLVSFTNCSAINDKSFAILMGLPIDNIPILSNNVSEHSQNCEITFNGEIIKTTELKDHSMIAILPGGWNGLYNKSK